MVKADSQRQKANSIKSKTKKTYGRHFAGSFERQSKHLSALQTGESAIITKILGHGAFLKRITEMGFIKGKRVTVIKNAPLKDPVEYEIMGYNLSLKRSEAQMVEVVSESDVKNIPETRFNGIL